MNPFEIGDIVENKNVIEITRNGKKRYYLCHQKFVVVNLHGGLVGIKNIEDGSIIYVRTSEICHVKRQDSEINIDTFSPRPWHLDGITIVDKTGIDVFTVLGFASQDERRANATLALCMPELVSACRVIVEIANLHEALLMSDKQIAQNAAKYDAAIARIRTMVSMIDNNIFANSRFPHDISLFVEQRTGQG